MAHMYQTDRPTLRGGGASIFNTQCNQCTKCGPMRQVHDPTCSSAPARCTARRGPATPPHAVPAGCPLRARPLCLKAPRCKPEGPSCPWTPSAP